MPATSIASAFIPAFPPVAAPAATLTLDIDVRSGAAADAILHTLTPEPLSALARTTRALRSAAVRGGRQVAFSLPLRPVLIVGEQGQRGLLARLGLQRGTGAIVQLQEGAIALTGTAEQIANTLLTYYDIGIEHFVLHGLGGAADAARYTSNLIPLVRHKVARRDAVLNILAG